MFGITNEKDGATAQAPAPAAMEPEQAADFAALNAAAAAPEQAAQLAEQEAAAQPPAQPSAAAMQMAAMIVGIVKPIAAFAVPSLKTAPDALWEPVPEGLAAVLDEYGASAEWMQSPWARLAISIAPLAAYAAMQSIKDKPQEKPAETLTAPAAAPMTESAPTGGGGFESGVIVGAVQT